MTHSRLIRFHFKAWLIIFGMLLGLWAWPAGAAIDASKLLPAEQAFVPTITVGEEGIKLQFTIADGYYLYRSKIEANTQPDNLLGQAKFSDGQNKTDDFFGTQEVYHQQALVQWSYQKPSQGEPYTLSISYQGCAEAGVCYPPVQNQFHINGDGQYQPAKTGSNPFLAPDNNAPPKPAGSDSSRFKLSWQTLNANLLAFFVAGLGLSLTACMYPLLPIVSSIIVGDSQRNKRRAFVLSMVYVQGLAITYTLVGMVAGLTGALLTVWLQQPWVVLAAAALMVALALAMFDVYSLQLPTALQSYFQTQSSRLSGGKIVSVLGMGMLSALIVGPCVAPPLAFALGYIGQTGDAALGGLALYALALGTGVPLVLVGTFGGHILPRAGVWMHAIKYTFGLILLAVAVYLATPFLPYGVVIAAYTLLLLIPAGLMLTRQPYLSGWSKPISLLLAVAMLAGGLYFATQSVRQQSTSLHRALTLIPPGQAHFGRTFFHPDDVQLAIEAAFASAPDQPVLLDFYADWCVSCKEMAAYTFSDPQVTALLDEARFLQIDVTANTPAQQAFLKEYGLYGPPGLFVVWADGRRSEPLLGFVPPAAFVPWYQEKLQP